MATKVKEIVYLEREERSSGFSTGFKYILEDGREIEEMSTDVIADTLTPSQEKQND